MGKSESWVGENDVCNSKKVLIAVGLGHVSWQLLSYVASVFTLPYNVYVASSVTGGLCEHTVLFQRSVFSTENNKLIQ